MEIWKYVENNWLCEVLFYDTNHHKNMGTTVSTGSKSQVPQYLASKNDQ